MATGQDGACLRMERFESTAALPVNLRGVLALPAGPNGAERALNVDVPLTGE